jgi:hypothetical protein
LLAFPGFIRYGTGIQPDIRFLTFRIRIQTKLILGTEALQVEHQVYKIRSGRRRSGIAMRVRQNDMAPARKHFFESITKRNVNYEYIFLNFFFFRQDTDPIHIQIHKFLEYALTVSPYTV